MKSSESENLVFPWPRHTAPNLLFPLFALVAVALHGASFYLFQIRYPSVVSLQSPPVQLQILADDSPANRALLLRIEAEDPALTIRPRLIQSEDRTDALLETAYAPSYALRATFPKTPPATTPIPPLPRSTLPTSVPSEFRSLALPQVVAPTPTEIRVGSGLKARPPSISSRLDYAPPVGIVLQPAVFLAGVSAEGAVSFLYLRESSGDAGADAAAEIWLQQTSFPRVNTPTFTWGTISVEWGTDIYSAR